MEFRVFRVEKIPKTSNLENCKILYMTNFENDQIFKIDQFEKLFNILDVQIISKIKINSKIKISNNLSFVILIFAISELQKIDRSECNPHLENF